MARSLSPAEALALLAAHGVATDVGSLSRFAEGRGWTVTVGAAVPSQRRHRWRATAFATRGGATPGLSTLTGATGRGATEEEAMAVAVAVAGMLRREG
jgi:hypothetical protein